jgi:hypothetical protein
MLSLYNSVLKHVFIVYNAAMTFWIPKMLLPSTTVNVFKRALFGMTRAEATN